MPDGRRTVVGVRLSDDDCARLDAMRGDTPRAELAYAIIKNTIGGITVLEPDPEIPPPELARAVEAARSRKTATVDTYGLPLDAQDLLAPEWSVSGRPPPEPAPASGGLVAQALAAVRGDGAAKHPCCRHCHHGGGKGHSHPCTKCK